MKKKFSLFVTYSQICVFSCDISEPFNDWEDKHTLQGFSWKNGSVSFDAIIDGGDAEIEVLITNNYKPMHNSEMIITVPFNVSEVAKIEIASISDSYTLPISSGLYSLFYESKRNGDDKVFCKLTFVKNNKAKVQIIKKLEWMKPEYPLLLETTLSI